MSPSIDRSVKKIDLKIIVKGSDMKNMLENQSMCRTWKILLKNSDPFNCSCESHHKKRVVDHPSNGNKVKFTYCSHSTENVFDKNMNNYNSLCC